MDKKVLLNKFLDKFVESGSSGAISKVFEYLRKNIESNNCENQVISGFLKMIALAYKNPGILSGGETIKDKFKEFVNSGLMIEIKGSEAEFLSDDIRNLKSAELLYILGWSVRQAKYKEKIEKKDFKSKEKDNSYKTNKGYNKVKTGSSGRDSGNNILAEKLREAMNKKAKKNM